jgi:hypothetical protein
MVAHKSVQIPYCWSEPNEINDVLVLDSRRGTEDQIIIEQENGQSSIVLSIDEAIELQRGLRDVIRIKKQVHGEAISK